MLDEIKEILAREGIVSASIIDDAFDKVPTSLDVNDESWNFFLDDVLDQEVAIIKDGYGVADPESRWGELRYDDKFIGFMWEHRGETEALQLLFESYIQRQASSKAQLEPLRALLFDDLNLVVIQNL
jgi:hypothetical protein